MGSTFNLYMYHNPQYPGLIRYCKVTGFLFTSLYSLRVITSFNAYVLCDLYNVLMIYICFGDGLGGGGLS